MAHVTLATPIRGMSSQG